GRLVVTVPPWAPVSTARCTKHPSAEALPASPATSGCVRADRAIRGGTGRVRAGHLGQQQASAPEEAERAEEGAAVGDAGAEQIAGRGPDERGEGGQHEEDGAEQVDGGNR